MMFWQAAVAAPVFGGYIVEVWWREVFIDAQVPIEENREEDEVSL